MMKLPHPFHKIETHSQQLARIGVFTFFALAVLFLLIVRFTGEVRGLAVVEIPSFFGLPKEVPLVVVAAGALAFFFRIIQLHGLIAKGLGIRHRYEVNQILIPLAQRSGVNLSPEYIARLREHRSPLMSELFWKYASYNDPKIDKHLIESAFDLWSWAYVAIQVSFVSLFLAPFLFYRHHVVVACAVVGLIVVLVGFVMFQIWQCRAVSAREVDCILSDSSRASKVKRRLSAL